MNRPLLILLACASLWACGGGDRGRLPGTLERDRLELVAESQEPVIELAVREGDRVARGQLLLRLDPSSIDTQLAQARAAVSRAEGVLAEQVSGPRREDILAARARLAGTQARLDAAGHEFGRVETLVAQRLLAQNDLDRTRAARDGALADRDAARENLLALERGTRSEVLDQARAAAGQAQAQLAQLQVSRARLDVVAPQAGVIDAVPYKLGERPPRGAPVVVMLADGRTYARVFVPQPIRVQVAAGTTAVVYVDGSRRSWAGQVRYVSTDAAFTPYYALNERDRSRLSYLAEVDLTDADAATLPAGVPVQVELAVGPAAP